MVPLHGCRIVERTQAYTSYDIVCIVLHVTNMREIYPMDTRTHSATWWELMVVVVTVWGKQKHVLDIGTI